MVICERQFWCLIERLPSPLPEVSNIPHPLQSSWTLSSVLSASYRSVFWVHSIPRIGWLDFRSDFESDLSQNFQCRSSRGGQAYLGLGWWWQWDVSEDEFSSEDVDDISSEDEAEISSEDVAEISAHAWDQLFLFDSESILCWWNISALYFSFSKICVAESYIFDIFVARNWKCPFIVLWHFHENVTFWPTNQFTGLCACWNILLGKNSFWQRRYFWCFPCRL